MTKETWDKYNKYNEPAEYVGKHVQKDYQVYLYIKNNNNTVAASSIVYIRGIDNVRQLVQNHPEWKYEVKNMKGETLYELQ